MSKTSVKRRQCTLHDFIHISKVPRSQMASSSSCPGMAQNGSSDVQAEDNGSLTSSAVISSLPRENLPDKANDILCSKNQEVGERRNEEIAESSTGSEHCSATLETQLPGEFLGTQNPKTSEEPFSSESDSVDSDYSSVTFSSDVLKRYTQFPPDLPPLRPAEDHTVLFNYNTVPNEAPSPYPKTYRDKWDNFHVRLPCSEQSLYPVKNAVTGESELQPRWSIIQNALRSPILSSIDLEEAILTYNTQYARQWNFKGLHRLFTEEFEPIETRHFFETLLPKMIDLCLQLPNICTQPIPLLTLGKSHKITLSQKQIACLLANAFFCTFPRRNTRNRNSEYGSYPGINFYTLFDSAGRPNKTEKMKCLINYFRCVTKDEPIGTVTFHRQMLKELPSWKESKKELTRLCVQSDGLIEVDGMGMLQIDFANKFVGGGVLSSGCVQEEIRFIICPELIVSRLFTERLDKNEALIITGCEQYNQHTGYAETFRWDGNFEDCMPRDPWKRKLTKIVAIDALHFACGSEQYRPELVQRELDKAYTGFFESSVDRTCLPAVATGNWGCGAFRGDPHLKSLIQLMSAAEAGRDILYLTFSDKKLEKDICKIYSVLKGRNMTVGQLAKMLETFYLEVIKTEGKESLYSFLYQKCMDPESDPEDATSS